MASFLETDTVLAVDTETTGVDPETDRICEIGYAIGVGVETCTIDLGSILVRPGVNIPKEAYMIHGVSDSAVEHAMTFKGAWQELCRVGTVHDVSVTCGYNSIGFDIPILISECKRHSADYDGPISPMRFPHIDVCLFVRWHLRHLPSRKLGDVAATFSVPLPDGASFHGAAGDSSVTLGLLEKLVKVGVIPDDVTTALWQQRLFESALEEEYQKYGVFLYEDRINGEIMIGTGSNTGEPISKVQQNHWRRLLKKDKITDTTREIAERMLK